MTSLRENPLFARLAEVRSVRVSGAGGGFDIYAGLPPTVYALRRTGARPLLEAYRALVRSLEVDAPTDTFREVQATVEGRLFTSDGHRLRGRSPTERGWAGQAPTTIGRTRPGRPLPTDRPRSL